MEWTKEKGTDSSSLGLGRMLGKQFLLEYYLKRCLEGS